MLQLPLRPLVPLSALALLGWCWYTFRRKRNPCERAEEGLLCSSAARKQSMAANVAIQEAAADGSALAAQDVIKHCHFHSQEKQEGGQNLDCNFSQLSSTTDDSSVTSGASQATVLVSTPIVRLLKGIRPEPEGEVSRAQASLLLAEKPEMEPEKQDDTIKGLSDFKVIETEAFAEQPTRIVCPEEHGVTNGSEKRREGGPSEVDGLAVEVLDGATGEIPAIGGGILKRKSPSEPRVTPQSQVRLRKEIDENNSLAVTKEDLGALTQTAEESVSSAHKPSNPPSAFPAGEDSGCSTWRSEDSVDAEKASSKSRAVEKTSSAVPLSSGSRYAVARKNEKLSRQKSDASKGANGVQCVNGESRVTSKRATQSSSPHTLWNIEVPSHLIGRLIGKKGTYITSLKESSGAKIYVSTLPYTYEFQVCHIEGSEAQVEKALALIRKKFKDLDLSNRLSSLQSAAVHPLPVTSWLLLPQDRTVEVIVPRVEAANYLFVQQHTHPTYYGLHGLSEQMLFCYSHSGCPSLPTPVEGTSYQQALYIHTHTHCIQVLPFPVGYLPFSLTFTHPDLDPLCPLRNFFFFFFFFLTNVHNTCKHLNSELLNNIVSIFLTAGVLCAAPSPDGAWWRAQVIQHYKDSNFVQIRYVDYGGYVTVHLASLKQIRLFLSSSVAHPSPNPPFYSFGWDWT
ncbi:uncharacterized protein akap1a isoform X2 [Ictalurus furcatus]|uniref:uncharacterized protein akap1a isoform X2 n=1 Tax=Ictalurus furcatus TaxID=66913 RepID=UPI0023507688|nr:uncharacterized protein akap1a isoform X2 [Ictalurus furcatus]